VKKFVDERIRTSEIFVFREVYFTFSPSEDMDLAALTIILV
jgi:hypothetical protein